MKEKKNEECGGVQLEPRHILRSSFPSFTNNPPTTITSFRLLPAMDTPPAPSFTTPVGSPKVLDALSVALDHRLDALPDLLGVFAGKKLLNKQLTGQLHHTAQEAPSVSPPFPHALDATDPSDRAFAFAITGRVRSLLLGMNEVNCPPRSRRSSAASTRSEQDSFRSFSPVFTSSTFSFDVDANGDLLSSTDEDVKAV